MTIEAVENSVFQFDNNTVVNEKCAKSNNFNVLDVSDVSYAKRDVLVAGASVSVLKSSVLQAKLVCNVINVL